MVIKYLLKFFLVLFFFVSHNHSKADFFKDITFQIENNDFRNHDSSTKNLLNRYLSTD